ncbi:phasin family protein [Massilia sp. TWR1-2-2]|uniref:phasin family protein n=1 Tax=Massilia sp. TWR1-2-2 TaxID=2804584 RepID=UPI003CFB2B39
MTNLPEQFSEARKLQLEAQFKFFQTFTGKAFESVEKLVALNIDASRQSLEQSSALMRQVMSAKDPRDLFAVTKQTQSQFDSALAYSRQLLGIVAAAPAETPAEAPAAAAPQAPSARLEAFPALAPEFAASVPPAAPIAEPTPIAKAAGATELPKPAAASFPVTSSDKPIEVTQVKPVDAEPAPAPVSGTPAIAAKQAAAAAAKAPRKK